MAQLEPSCLCSYLRQGFVLRKWSINVLLIAKKVKWFRERELRSNGP